MDKEEQALQELKDKMTPEQVHDMADLIQNDLKRREKEKAKMAQSRLRPKEKSAVKSSAFSSDLDQDHLGDIYRGIDGEVKSIRLKKLEAKLAEAKRQKAMYGKFEKAKKRSRVVEPALGKLLRAGADISQAIPRGNAASSHGKNLLLMGAVVGLAALKVVFSTGIVDASMGNPNTSLQLKAGAVELRQDAEKPGNMRNAEKSSQASSTVLSGFDRTPGQWTESEKQVLLSLDARRVELEKRRSALEKKETEITLQAQKLAERMVELRTLTGKLAEQREEKDHRYEARLEQLAQVYTSMAPKEAAPLIAKFDDELALSLLERMPGKRMGQILSLMPLDRAVELTRSLTDKKKL